jgi:hypothetical protein
MRQRTRKLQKGAGVFNQIRQFFTRRAAPPQSTFMNRMLGRKPAVVPFQPSKLNIAPTVVLPLKGQRIPNVGLIPLPTNTRIPPNFTKPVAVLPPPQRLTTHRNGRTIRFESLEEGMMRMLGFFYSKSKQIPIRESITPAEYKDLRSSFSNFMDQHPSISPEQSAKEFFHTDIETLNAEIQEVEKQGKILFPGTNSERIAESYGGFYTRYVKWLLRTPVELRMAFNADKYQCSVPPSIVSESVPSLSTLQSNACIFLFRGIEKFRDEWDARSIQNYIIVEKNALQMTDVNTIVARYLTKSALIHGIFVNWSVEGIDPYLVVVLQREAPELLFLIHTRLQSGEELPSISTNFILFHEDALPEGTVDVYSNPLKLSVLRRAFRDKKIYGMSPYVAFQIKRLDSNLWQSAFTDPNLEVYGRLSVQQQLIVDYLQFQLFLTNKEQGQDTFYSESLASAEVQQNIRNILESIPSALRDLQTLVKQIFRKSTSISMNTVEEVLQIFRPPVFQPVVYPLEKEQEEELESTIGLLQTQLRVAQQRGNTRRQKQIQTKLKNVETALAYLTSQRQTVKPRKPTVSLRTIGFPLNEEKASRNYLRAKKEGLNLLRRAKTQKNRNIVQEKLARLNLSFAKTLETIRSQKENSEE